MSKADIYHDNISTLLRQLRVNGLIDKKLLNLFTKIPRSTLIPESSAFISCIDDHIKIKPSLYQMSLQLFARIISLINIRNTESVLEIGSGCGYNALILANLAHNVDSVTVDLQNVHQAMLYSKKNLNSRCKFYNYIPEKKYDIVIVSGGTYNNPIYKNYAANNGRGIYMEFLKFPQQEFALADLKIFSKNGTHYAEKLIERISIFNLENIP